MPAGIYVVNVNDYLYSYQQVLVEVTDREVKAYQYNYKTGKGLKHKIPFLIHREMKLKYEEDAPNVFEAIIKSPYAYIIGITLLMFACMQMVPQDELKKSMQQFNNMKNNINQ